MTLYTTGAGIDYITAHDLVKDTGDLSSATPAVLKNLVGGTGIDLSNDASNFTIATSFDIADYTTTANINTNHYTKTDIDTQLGFITSYTPAVKLITNVTIQTPALDTLGAFTMSNNMPIQAWTSGAALESAMYLRSTSDNMVLMASNNAMIDIEQNTSNGGGGG